MPLDPRSGFGFGSGFGSIRIRIWILDPDPAIFVIDLQGANKKLFFNAIFSAYYFLKVYLHHFSKIKSQKESQNSRNQDFMDPVDLDPEHWRYVIFNRCSLPDSLKPDPDPDQDFCYPKFKVKKKSYLRVLLSMEIFSFYLSWGTHGSGSTPLIESTLIRIRIRNTALRWTYLYKLWTNYVSSLPIYELCVHICVNVYKYNSIITVQWVWLNSWEWVTTAVLIVR